jgi:hypothetical protein
MGPGKNAFVIWKLSFIEEWCLDQHFGGECTVTKMTNLKTVMGLSHDVYDGFRNNSY